MAHQIVQLRFFGIPRPYAALINTDIFLEIELEADEWLRHAADTVYAPCGPAIGEKYYPRDKLHLLSTHHEMELPTASITEDFHQPSPHCHSHSTARGSGKWRGDGIYYYLFLAVAGEVGRISPQGSFFPVSGIFLSVDWYSRSMALSYSFCSLVRDGLSSLKCNAGVGI
jgi:hypothetical protein